jgi:hypothetical protein
MAPKQCPPCDAAKVCNPGSGRCVLRSGKIGQQVLGGAATPAPKSKTPAPQAASGTKACPPCVAAKVCNPGSGRCVLRSGKIGQQVLGPAPRAATPAARAVTPAPRAAATNASAANNRAVVNASSRGAHKVPAGRKAPPGHAKNFAHRTARGIDGGLWKSQQVKVKGSVRYRWVPVK